MTLNSNTSIATFIVNSISVSAGISGNMVDIVDLARQHVSNYVGETINGSSIDLKYVPAIIDFAKADALEQDEANGSGDDLRLEGLTVAENNSSDSSSAMFRQMGEDKLKALGRKVSFSRSLS